MKTKDRLKEEIGFYKLLIGIVSAVSSSLISLVFSGDYNLIKNILLLTISISLVLVAAFFIIKIYTNIEELDYE